MWSWYLGLDLLTSAQVQKRLFTSKILFTKEHSQKWTIGVEGLMVNEFIYKDAVCSNIQLLRAAQISGSKVSTRNEGQVMSSQQ